MSFVVSGISPEPSTKGIRHGSESSHVARANASGKAVNRADIARSLGVTLPTYEKRFSLIKSMLGIRL